jgi:ankyrin repeat protein
VARAGHTRDAASALGACRDFWLNNVEMHWAVVKAGHGAHKRTLLMWACASGYLPRVVELIEWTSDVNAVDADGRAPLHYACAEGHLEVARELLKRGAKIEAKTKNGWTALHAASFRGHAALVRLLLNEGAQIEVKDDEGCTPLYCASQEGELEAVRLLLERGAVADARAIDGSTALMFSCEKGHAAVVRELLQRGADANAHNNVGATALHFASYHGRAEAMRELLKRHDVNINVQDEHGTTPLMDACKEGNLMTATILIGAGADLALLDNNGKSALRFAVQLVRRDAAPPAAGVEPVAPASREEHKALVAVLKAHGAT